MNNPAYMAIIANNTLTKRLVEQSNAFEPIVLRPTTSIQTLLACEDVLPDIILLDVDACDNNLLLEIGRLQAIGYAGPIILISSEKICYPPPILQIRRPFRLKELSELLENYPSKVSPSLNRTQRISQELTEKEAAIFNRLLQVAGRGVEKSALLQEIWGYGPEISTRTLETHIHRLRRKIVMDPTHEWSLLTSDEGYKLVKKVKDFPHK